MQGLEARSAAAGQTADGQAKGAAQGQQQPQQQHGGGGGGLINLASLQQTILGNLQIRLTNLHIRYTSPA